MTSPGKTSSGSWICGFRSTINGSPHLSLIVWRVSPSLTTYISSHGRPWSCFPLTSSPPSVVVTLSLIDAIKIRPNSTILQYHEELDDDESAMFLIDAAFITNYCGTCWRSQAWILYYMREIKRCADLSRLLFEFWGVCVCIYIGIYITWWLFKRYSI